MNTPKQFYKNYYQYIRGIETCIAGNLISPALTLIYSGIDTVAWLAYGDIPVKERYIKWVENYMYTEKPLNPRPIDLYAARCAILHTLTPESSLSKSGDAEQIKYAWGKASVEKLENRGAELNISMGLCLHINDLFESFRFGIANFLEQSSLDSECIERMQKHYVSFGMEQV